METSPKLEITMAERRRMNVQAGGDEAGWGKIFRKKLRKSAVRLVDFHKDVF